MNINPHDRNAPGATVESPRVTQAGDPENAPGQALPAQDALRSDHPLHPNGFQVGRLRHRIESTPSTQGSDFQRYSSNLAQLYGWLTQVPHDEDRTVAAVRIVVWADAADPSVPLDLSGLGLRSVPVLPQNVQILELGQNRLTVIPPDLPSNLQKLNLAHNEITEIAPHLPATLEQLDVSHNRLIQLPSHLPPGLRSLAAHNNLLTHLPNTLPQSLFALFAGDNQITGLPSALPPGLRHLHMDGNPVTDDLDRLWEETVDDLPETTFGDHSTPPRALADAVLDWAPGLSADWADFQHEEHAGSFSRFLDRLRGTVNDQDANFRDATTEWLHDLTKHSALRTHSFLISEGADASCEDRISLTLNDMRKAALSFQVAQGAYDDRVPDLIELGRGMFRLDRLEEIARKKVVSLPSDHEALEVYLAFQVKLKDALALPIATPDMRFFEVAEVTAADLAQAQADVLAAEKKHFPDYLVCEWAPWENVLQRLDKPGADAMQHQLYDALETQFQPRLAAALAQVHLSGDPDAERAVGTQVSQAILQEIKRAFTQRFLAERGMQDLIPLSEEAVG